ncbi:MAG: hypothetical protein NW237_17030 [Cyanobacteriota bacterium]|nr:hypothetical protein [Cyanobacteriota bacterium]
MSTSNLLELAREGDPQAIARVVNQALQPKGITAKAILQSDVLNIALESANLPPRQKLAPPLQKMLVRLAPRLIRTVRLYGVQTGSKTPDWSQTFDLLEVTPTPPPPVVASPPSPANTSLPPLPLVSEDWGVLPDPLPQTETQPATPERTLIGEARLSSGSSPSNADNPERSFPSDPLSDPTIEPSALEITLLDAADSLVQVSESPTVTLAPTSAPEIGQSAAGIPLSFVPPEHNSAGEFLLAFLADLKVSHLLMAARWLGIDLSQAFADRQHLEQVIYQHIEQLLPQAEGDLDSYSEAELRSIGLALQMQQLSQMDPHQLVAYLAEQGLEESYLKEGGA